MPGETRWRDCFSSGMEPRIRIKIRDDPLKHVPRMRIALDTLGLHDPAPITNSESIPHLPLYLTTIAPPITKHKRHLCQFRYLSAIIQCAFQLLPARINNASHVLVTDSNAYVNHYHTAIRAYAFSGWFGNNNTPRYDGSANSAINQRSVRCSIPQPQRMEQP